MVASWLIGRGRVAAGERPSWLAAWGLVAFDFAVLLLVFWLILGPLLAVFQSAGMVLRVAVMFVVFFVPMQIVLITSSIWASRSRWQDKDTGNS